MPGFPVDLSTIRSREQLEATQEAAERGCAWCGPDDRQKSPLLKRFPLVDVRKNAYPKDGCRMYLIILKRHAPMSEMTPEEMAAVFGALNWLIQSHNLRGGGIIHRFGDRNLNASSLPDDHFFMNIIVPHGDQPVAETLVKDTSPEAVARRKKRAEGFTG